MSPDPKILSQQIQQQKQNYAKPLTWKILH